MVCNENGGIKDDIFVYRTGDTEYLLCVNASNREKILAWLMEHRTTDDLYRSKTVPPRSPRSRSRDQLRATSSSPPAPKG